MASEIKQQGLIPVSTQTYAKNYNLGDDLVGKYISLSGSRKFYNPGIGLTLASPSSGPVNNTLTAISTSTPSHQGSVISSNTNGDTAFVGYPDLNWSGDNISGLVTRGFVFEDHSNNEGHLVDSTSVHPNTSVRAFNVLTPGQYVFNVKGSGDAEWSTVKPFNFDFVFCINVNGLELNLFPVMGAQAKYVGGGVQWYASVNWTIDNYISPAFTLNTGDYVLLYCKGIAAYKNISASYTITNLEFDIKLTTTSSPTQTTFTNPLNIADFKTSFINFYGGNRDTLILQGTKLTNN